MLADKQHLFLQCLRHPRVIAEANALLGLRRHALRRWLLRDYVFRAFSPLSAAEALKLQSMIERWIEQSGEIVLSAPLRAMVLRSFPGHSRYVVDAHFDRVFHSPRVRELINSAGKRLSNRPLRTECEQQ